MRKYTFGGGGSVQTMGGASGCVGGAGAKDPGVKHPVEKSTGK